MSNALPFRISPEVTNRFPAIKVGVALITGATVVPKAPGLRPLKRKLLPEIEARVKGVDITTWPRVQGFRDIYREFGADPNSHRPSSEALLRRIASGAGLYTINTVVDAYNIFSAFHQLPMAAYDLDKISGPIELRFARGDEWHRPIGQENTEQVPAGELVYADQEEVICREFNYRDSDKTKITLSTQNILFFTDGCSSITRDDVQVVLDEVARAIAELTNGHVEQTQLFP